MLFLLHAKLTKPEDMSNKEFYGIWQKNVVAALGSTKVGVVKSVYKVAGRPEAYIVFDAATTDVLEQSLHTLPIWKFGYFHLVTELEWIPLQSYADWVDELTQAD